MLMQLSQEIFASMADVAWNPASSFLPRADN